VVSGSGAQPEGCATKGNGFGAQPEGCATKGNGFGAQPGVAVPLKATGLAHSQEWLCHAGIMRGEWISVGR